MGCTQAKHSQDSPPQGVEKLKRETGYAKVSHRRRPIYPKHSEKNDFGKLSRTASKVSDGSRRKRVVFTEPEKVKIDGDSGNVSRNSPEKIEGNELVDSWPRWFLDNIPADVLAGLVPKSADSYDKLAKVGQGTYSNVYKARDRDTGKLVALKKVRFDTSEPESVKFMAREIMMLQKLDHPNIIKLEGIVISRMQYSLYLVFDFMQSDLTRIISRPGERLTEAQVKCYMQQLLSGLQHCHERGILHRDIKASNILIDKSGMLKIADFGLANFFPPKPRRPLTNRVVTLWYRAPELLLGSTDYGVGIDLWSAGCLLAEMFVGKPIMPGRTEVEQLHRIFKLCGSPVEDYWKIMKLPASFRPPRHYESSLRDSFPDFPDSSFSLLSRLLSLDPACRGSAASALENEFFSSSPLACDLSALPVMYNEEDELTQTSYIKKHRRSRRNRASRKNEAHHKKKLIVIQAESSKEESNALNNQDVGGSTSNTSSSYKSNRNNDNSLPISLSPLFQSNHKRFSRTEGHPNALKNIKNYSLLQASTLLQASVTDIINPKEGNVFANFHRSLSTLDLRSLNLTKMPKPSESDKE